MVSTFTNKSEIYHFLEALDSLKKHEILAFLGTIFFYMQNGMINSENKANEHDVSDEGEILLPADLGIDSLTEVAFELAYASNAKTGGSFPKHEFYNSIDCWIKRTPALDEVESLFHKLSFKHKLYALAEIFCRIGNKDIQFDFNKFDIDGYFTAHI